MVIHNEVEMTIDNYIHDLQKFLREYSSDRPQPKFYRIMFILRSLSNEDKLLIEKGRKLSDQRLNEIVSDLLAPPAEILEAISWYRLATRLQVNRIDE